jgi:hypothetical protein
MKVSEIEGKYGKVKEIVMSVHPEFLSLQHPTERSLNPRDQKLSEPRAYRRDVPKAEVQSSRNGFVLEQGDCLNSRIVFSQCSCEWYIEVRLSRTRLMTRRSEA